ncbi:MAG: Gldg family protein [Candidatus Helarchaeota archaeon]
MKKKIKVAFDLSHNEILKIGNKGEHEWESWTQAEELIRNKGFEIELIKNGPLNELDLSEFNILVFGSPQSEFTKDEINCIVAFVKSGGSLLALNDQGGDLRNKTNLSEITKNFGIEFNNDRIHDKINNIKGYDYGPIISDFDICSSITFNIREFNLLLACSLKVTNDAVVIARTSKDAFVKIRTSENKWKKKELNSLPVIAIYEDTKNKGRITAIGDCHLFSDDDAGMPLYYNRLLFNNIFDWLSENSLETDSKIDLLTLKINKIGEDLVKLKDKLGIIETGPSVLNPDVYDSDKMIARINQLETILKKLEQKIGEEEISYYRKRVNLQIWAIIISLISVIVVLIVSFLKPVA